MTLRFLGMPTDVAAAYRAGALDANGQSPERAISDGDGVPCRHCLKYVEAGEPYLTLAYRPFPAPQPYAEIGPVFLHAEACPPHASEAGLPTRHQGGNNRQILRGYGANDRIVYGTGMVVAPAEIAAQAEMLLRRDDVAYVHMRSATNNCFTLRIERA
ncbi:MAG: hypothetical protein JWP26_598 [Devosia sp.]|uniref:DUF1203 domain-containing protein n=1 Tax=Devosia sp. TaxID=1871048 RepID=UPI00260D05EE|nr:DUF1203 domain-containing protein [Devosia sp.]MDB5535835.1 hypothetical protein [Devosia sp.]MDB5585628.1 hypothetical protein [Devosia sp.]